MLDNMLELIKARLGANYIEDTEDIIEDIIDDMTTIASHASNRTEDDEKLIPYIKKAVVAEYLARGAEGLTSRSEGSVSSSFDNIEARLRKDVQQVRLLR